MLQLQETLDKIAAIIDTYEGLSEDFSSPYFIQQLRDKLSAYAVYLGTFEAEFRKDFNAAEHTYKVAKLSERLKNRKGGMSIADAESEAELAVQAQHAIYLDQEHGYFQVRNMREQVNKLLDSMSSRLRIIMSEDGSSQKSLS